MSTDKIKKFFNKDGFLIGEFAEVIQDYIKRLKDKDIPLDDIIRDCAKNIHYLDNHYTIMKEYYKRLDLKINSQKSGIFGKQIFVLSHFAMRVWDKSHRGAIMLYGHSHGTLDELKPEFTSPTWIGDDYFIKNYKTMDVGVDTNKLYPYHLDEILMIMKDREILLNVDHHSKTTN